MQISIVHLSDIHFKKTGKNVIINRTDKIFNAVKNNISKTGKLFIVTSGDIAFSGDQEEYKIAYNFYKKLIEDFKDYTSLDSQLLFVPGNHDCHHDKDTSQVRSIVLKSILTDGFSEISEQVIDICCKPQNDYFEFVKNLSKEFPVSCETALDHPLLSIKTFKLDDGLIKFNLFNSAWSSTLDENIGDLKFPITYLEDRIPPIQNILSISIVHHPFNWQNPEVSRQFRDELAHTSEIIITGHEHHSNNSIFNEYNEEYKTIHIESGVLQDSDHESTSQFNLLKIELKDSKIQINQYKYENGIYNLSNIPEWKNIERNKKLKSRPFTLKPDFYKDVENPGASFTHRNVNEIKLEDIYTAPIFNKITYVSGKKQKLINYVHSESALNIPVDPADNFFKLILGAESSGKTAILKYHFLRYYALGFFPVFLDGEKFTEVSEEKIKILIGKEFRKQYNEIEGKFEEIDYRKIVVIIDDFQKFNYKKGKIPLIGNLTNIFSKIIITGNEFMLFETFTDKDRKNIDLYKNFDTYLIQDFNPTQRNLLIEKWYRLGTDYMDEADKVSYYHKVDRATENINLILGKNLIPAYPLFVLSFLQALESEESDSTSNKVHAYYYEMLITKSLKKALKDKDDLGYYMTLSKEYCYFLFNEKIRFSALPQNDFFKFLASHQKKYKISIANEDNILNTLVKGKILHISYDKNITVAYKYLYYYFVAKYLSDNIENDEVKNSIDLMSDRVYREEYANIILFLTHLSRNSYVIKKLIEKSRVIFSNLTPLKMEKDVDFINELQISIPLKVLSHIEVEDARDSDLKAADNYESMVQEFEEQTPSPDYDINEDINSLDLISIQTKALRTLNILGQITKKYWGELQGDEKFALAEETLLLGLRTLQFFYSLIDGSKEFLVEHISQNVQKAFVRDKISKSDIEDYSSNFIFNLSSAYAFGILKRVINAIGTEKLADIFEDVNSKYDFNSVSIIMTGIKLDHYKSFPSSDIDKVATVNAKNPLGFTTLQNFVIDHLYMYPVAIEKKQQICEKLKIKMPEQRLIAETSLVKKASLK